MKRKSILFLAAQVAAAVLLLAVCDIPSSDGQPPPQPPQAAMPVAYPPPGGYELGTLVALTTETEGAAIYFTTDGTDPLASEDLRYAAPVPIVLANGQTLAIRALAAKEGMTASDTLEALYTLPRLSGTATILGEPEGGHILRAAAEFDEEAEGAISYQWMRGDAADAVNEPIKNAAGETYALTPDDQGRYVTVMVSRDTVNEGALYAAPVLIRAPSLYWTAIPGGDGGQSGFGTSAINSIAFGNEKYVAVGAGGKMAWSEDGVNWTAVRPGLASGTTRFPATADIYSIAFGNGRFVAGGVGGLMAHSANGSSWTGIDPGTNNYTTTTFPPDSAIRHIAVANGKFLAVGLSSRAPGNAAFSGNGTQWTTTNINENIGGFTGFYRAACGNGTWVVAGQRSIYDTISRSTDEGQSWTSMSAQATFGASIIYALAFADGKFVAGGGEGKMAWSEDGENWTAIPPGGEDNTTATFGSSAINDIAVGAGKWIAVGEGGKMARSEDGTRWEAVPPGTGPYTAAFGTSAIRGVAFCNGRFYAAGAGGKMAYSNLLEEQTGQ
jgi:hypothetical protein